MTSLSPRRLSPPRPHLRLQLHAGLDVESLRVQGTTHTFTAHAHPNCTITLIEQNMVDVTLAGQTVTCTPGAVILIDAWERHSARAHRSEPWTSLSYRLPTFTLEAAARHSGQLTERQSLVSPPGLHSQVVYDQGLFAVLQTLHQRPSEIELLQTLGLLLRKYGHFTSREVTACGAVQAARDFFETQPGTSIRLRALASALGVSVSHLVRSFHTQVGYSPHEYLLLCRSEHARHHLRTGESLAQTALLCGYYDQSHLTGQFKRVFGITPARYAAAVQVHQTPRPHDDYRRQSTVGKCRPEVRIFSKNVEGHVP